MSRAPAPHAGVSLGGGRHATGAPRSVSAEVRLLGGAGRSAVMLTPCDRFDIY